MDWLNYHHLLNFWLVAREGSVQRASALLHVTPASVSIQVKQLERALGVQLLRKHGRGLQLTETGEEVAQYASQIFNTGRELLEVVRGNSSAKAQTLRVGIRDVMPKLVAFQLLQPALEQNPDLRIVCEEAEMPELVTQLAIHKLDVILTDTALDPVHNVRAHSHRLGESAVVIVGTQELADQFREGFPESLNDAPFLLPLESSALRSALDLWFLDQKLAPKIKGEFADSAMLKIAARGGLGLIAAPQRILHDIDSIYGLTMVGTIPKIKERFYAISVNRKIEHPAVIAIREHKI